MFIFIQEYVEFVFFLSIKVQNLFNSQIPNLIQAKKNSEYRISLDFVIQTNNPGQTELKKKLTIE